MSGASPLAVTLAGIPLQNPILLAAGTAGYGKEVADVIRLDALGGLVTKAVSLEVRHGAAAPRVSEFDGGMINAVGLANPGVDAVAHEMLPWLQSNLRQAKVLVNVVGSAVEHFAAVIERLDSVPGKDGYELNVSCPNVRAGGLEFGADPKALREVVSRARGVTKRPLVVKLSPTLPDIVGAARTAVEAGGDGVTLTNTFPGLVIDVERRRPALGFGTGGVSGPALLPLGVLATWKVYQALSIPIVGVGGVSSGREALQYVLAGATAVGVGTAAMRDPRAPERIVREVQGWMDHHRIANLTDIRGSLQWPA